MTNRTVVRHNGSLFRRLAGRAIVLSMVFAGLLIAYFDDDVRQMLSKGRRQDVSLVGVLFLSALICAPLLDLLFALVTTRRGLPALVIDERGVWGRIFHRPRQLAWADVEAVADVGDDLAVAPRRRGLAALLALLPTRFGPHNAMNSMIVRLSAVDTSREEILVAIALHDPRFRRP